MKENHDATAGLIEAALAHEIDRREFLRLAAGTTGGAALAVVLAGAGNAPRALAGAGSSNPVPVFAGTERIGQLTGSTDATTSKDRPQPWPTLIDSEGFPLLTDTGAWGAVGLDLGANTEHVDGRLYIFTGDVAVELDPAKPAFSGNYMNADLV